MSRAGWLVVVSVLAACGGPASEDNTRGQSSDDSVTVTADDPARRIEAIRELVRRGHADTSALEALVRLQGDRSPDVRHAAIQALNTLSRPGAESAQPPAEAVFEVVKEQVMVAPARIEWRSVVCQPDQLAGGEKQVACWMLIEVPPVYKTLERRVPKAEVGVPTRDESRRRPVDEKDPALPGNAVPRWLPGSGSAAGTSGQPPPGARPGEAWCVILIPKSVSGEGGARRITSSRREWRRNQSCEVPPASK